MSERERVAAELEERISACGDQDWATVSRETLRRAAEMIREQEPRVLSAEEIRSGEAVVVWLEDKDRENVIPGLWFRLSNEGGDEAVDIHVMDGFIGARLAEYNKRWRAWTVHPSDEQRKAVKWDD